MSREAFYKNQLEERESIIDELKIVLELTETKYKNSEEIKIRLQEQIKDCKEKLKKMGLL